MLNFEYVATNSTDTTILEEILEEHGSASFKALVHNRSCPENLLKKIVDLTKISSIVLSVCEHPNTGVKLVEHIWDHERWGVKNSHLYLISNPNCPERFYYELLELNSPKYAYLISCTDETPTPVLQKMFAMFQNDKRFLHTYQNCVRALFFRDALPEDGGKDWPLEWVEPHFGFVMNKYGRLNKEKNGHK